MMTQDEAAKYMVVAWVKEWSLLTYLKTVTGETKPDCYKAHEQFEWLPHGLVNFSQKYARRYIADNFPSLSNKLWDAKTNQDRLALFKLVMRPIGAKNHTHYDAARKAAHAGKAAFSRSKLAESVSVAAMRKGSGHHWNVCK